MTTRAWRVPSFNVYAATETGGIAAECSHHRGMHLFEDLVFPEVVDDDYRPVSPGELGDRLLVTVLFSRTIPLIRYEMTDRIRLAAQPCRCRLPFRLLDSIEGRTDDVLVLPTADGNTIGIHPIVFDQVLDLVDAAGWQVRQQPDDLEVLIARPGPRVDPTVIGSAVRAALVAAGAAAPAVSVFVVDAIPAGAAGKRPLILSRSAASAVPPFAP